MRHLLTALSYCVAVSAVCPAADPPAKDAYGDPLPDGSVARLGTERMKVVDISRQELGPSFVLHPDGKRLYTNFKNRAREVDLASGKIVGRVGPAGQKTILALSADGKRAFGNDDWKMQCWEVGADKPLNPQKPPGFDASPTAFGSSQSANGELVALAAFDHDPAPDKRLVARLYSVREQKELQKFEVIHNRQVNVKLSGDGSRLATWGEYTKQGKPKDGEKDPPTDPQGLSKQVQFWDAKTGKEIATASIGGDFPVSAVAMAPGGDRAVVSAGDGVITLLDVASGKTLRRAVGCEMAGRSLEFSPDGRRFATTAAAGVVQQWETESGKLLDTIPFPLGDHLEVRVTSLVYTAADRALAAAVVGRAVAVWEVPSGKLVCPLDGHRERVTAVTFSADGTEIISAGFYNEVLRWDLTGKPLGPMKLHRLGRSQPLAVEVRKDIESFIQCGPARLARNRTRDGGAEVFNLAGEQLFEVATGGVFSPKLAASGDGKTLALLDQLDWDVRHRPCRLTVFDVAEGTKRKEIDLLTGAVLTVAVNQNGTQAVVTQHLGIPGAPRVAFYLLDLNSGKRSGETELEWPDEAIPRQASFAPDGSHILLGWIRGNGVQVHDLATGKAQRLGKLTLDVTAPPMFSPDGKRVAIAYYNGSQGRVQVFDWKTRERTHSFDGHSDPISCLAFSADGKTLATGSYDTTILLWDLSKEK